MIRYTTVFLNLHTTRDITEKRECKFAGGASGWETVKVGTEEVTYNVAVDFDSEQIAQMARIAARNKSQKCKNGAILVEVVTRGRL
jgi:hypothetical protein